MRKIFTITIFIFSFSVFAKAQLIVNYHYLEVIDSDGSPIKDASVGQPNFYWKDKRPIEKKYSERLTDENGKLTMLIYFEPKYEFGQSLFRVTKSGYFPFFDLGIGTWIVNNEIHKVELLKIPSTEEERKKLGNEQIKREFLQAALDGDSTKVSQLIKAGISPNLNITDLRGMSELKSIPAILFAAASGNGATVVVLLEAKANLRQAENTEHSALAYYFAKYPFFNWTPDMESQKLKVMKQYEKGAESLIDAGARLENLNSDKANALMLAAEYGYTGIVKMLLEKGMSVNAQDAFGKTALHYTNPYYHKDTIELLLNAGADPNIIYSPYGDKKLCQTFLLKTLEFGGNVEIVKLLIAHQVDVNFTCKNGDNALRRAKQKTSPNFIEIVKLLKEAGAK